MRSRTIDDTSGMPVAVIAEQCEEPGCEKRFVLPRGGLGFPELPHMPLTSEMPDYLADAGWKQDAAGRWLCSPKGHPVLALPVDAEQDRENVLRTQEFAIPDLAADPETTVPDPAEQEDETDA